MRSMTASRSAFLRSACAAALFASTAAVAVEPIIFASDYSSGATGVVTAQGGLAYGYSSNLSGTGGDFSYSYAPSVPNAYNGGFGVQEKNNLGTANAYFGLAFTAPGSTTALTPVNLLGQARVLVRVGNYAPPATGVTVVLANGKNATTQYTDPNTDKTATAVCSASVTLPGTGGGAYDGTYPGGSANGTNTFSIPLTSFTCSKGTVATLSYTLTVVGVEMIANASNPSLAAAGALAYPVVQYVAFSK